MKTLASAFSCLYSFKFPFVVRVADSLSHGADQTSFARSVEGAAHRVARQLRENSGQTGCVHD